MALALMSVGLGAPACKGDQEPEPADAQAEPRAPSLPSEPAVPTDPADVVHKWRERLENDPALATSEDFPTMRSQLRTVANEADDVHLRANAALLLGAAHEARKEIDEAIGLYRHATKLVADDAGPHMALALALASAERFE